MKCKLLILHVDHGIRADSAEDAQWVKQLAHHHQLPFLVEHLANPPVGETQAREVRYEALTHMASQAGLKYVALAHHRRDQIETRLHNLLRGCSPAGLKGMSPVRQHSSGILLLRPALGMSPEWLHDGVLHWREDESNATGRSPRHRLRRDVLPVLEELVGRDLHQALETTARLALEDDAALNSLVPVNRVLALDQASKLSPAVLRRWLRRWAPLEAAQTDRGVEALAQGFGVDLGKGLRLNIEGGMARLELKR